MENNYDILDESLSNEIELEVKPKRKNIFVRVCLTFLNKNKKEYFILTIIVHLMFHILLLSILESLFFFKYVSIIEKESFLLNLKNSINEINKYNIHNENIKTNISTVYYSLYNDDQLKKYFDKLDNSATKGETDRIKNNKKLFHKSFNACYFIGSIFTVTLLIVKYFYKLRFRKLIVEHILFMLGILLYEYWFFISIILKFNPISSEETNYIIVSCIYHNFNQQNNIFKYIGNCPLN